MRKITMYGLAGAYSIFSLWAVTGYAQTTGRDSAAQDKSSSASPASASAVSAQEAEPPALAPGPLSSERQELMNMINSSKKLGVGIGPYIGAFGSIEAMVKAGAPQDAIQKRMESLKRSLVEQVERMKEIKQRPSQLPAPAAVSPTASANDSAAHADKGALLDKLKEKFGDRLPGALSDPGLQQKLSDPQVRERLLQNPAAQKILERLQGGE